MSESKLATLKGKAFALKQLRLRRQANKKVKRVDNSRLYAGSDMYYYCQSCGEEIRLPEAHTCSVPSLCTECKAMKECGWLE
ncbi:MAG: hypothetical protein V1846_01170 [Candidatus Komeilibacteria bacterium]